MILSDVAILERMDLPDNADNKGKRITIEPFDIEALQGASVDLRLGDEVIANGALVHLSQIVWSFEQRGLMLPPGQCCLAHTLEYVVTPTDCVARVEGKSSIGRQHILIHCTAGWLDPGFKGNITLEIVNLHPTHSFLLEPDMFICQLTYLQLDQPAERVYKGKYQGDRGAQGAKP